MMKDTRTVIAGMPFRFLVTYRNLTIHRIALRFQFPDMEGDDMEYAEASPQYVKTAKRYYLAAMKERFSIRWRFRVMKNAYAERLRVALLPVTEPATVVRDLIFHRF